jgi:hypothetical protein
MEAAESEPASKGRREDEVLAVLGYLSNGSAGASPSHLKCAGWILGENSEVDFFNTKIRVVALVPRENTLQIQAFSFCVLTQMRSFLIIRVFGSGFNTVQILIGWRERARGAQLRARRYGSGLLELEVSIQMNTIGQQGSIRGGTKASGDVVIFRAAKLRSRTKWFCRNRACWKGRECPPRMGHW